MKTLVLKEKQDEVYYLSNNGFKKGWIHSIHVHSESLAITYRVKCSDHCDVYYGDEKRPSEVWDTYEEMLEYFTFQFEFSDPEPTVNNEVI